VDYPNDRWNGGMIYRGVQEDFGPSVGFLSRNGYRQYNPYVNFSPRPRNHRFIRRMGFTADIDLRTGLGSDYVSRIWNLTVLNVDFHTQDTFSVLVIRDQERLDRVFRLSRIALPAGSEYTFVRYRVAASTANRRTVAVAPSMEWGAFYSGRTEAPGGQRHHRSRAPGRDRLPLVGMESGEPAGRAVRNAALPRDP